jgi:hypothetical protein
VSEVYFNVIIKKYITKEDEEKVIHADTETSVIYWIYVSFFAILFW